MSSVNNPNLPDTTEAHAALARSGKVLKRLCALLPALLLAFLMALAVVMRLRARALGTAVACKAIEFSATLKRWYGVAAPLLVEIADPRGRCNRQAFLRIALTFLGLQVGVGVALWLADIQMSTTSTILFNAPIFWIGTSVCVKRLHDVGRRGWWIPGALGIWLAVVFPAVTILSIVLGDNGVDTNQTLYLIVFCMVMFPALSALLWLHCKPSMPCDNKFGPVATGLGLSMPARGRKSAAVEQCPAMA